MTTFPRIPVIVLTALALPGCYVQSADCTPTRTAARPADKVDVRVATRSGTVEARLTAGGEALPGRELRFEILDDGAVVHDDSASTGSTGVARLDLKRVDPGSLVALARADRFRVTFAGDSEHCRSSDEAAFRTVRS